MILRSPPRAADSHTLVISPADSTRWSREYWSIASGCIILDRDWLRLPAISGSKAAVTYARDHSVAEGLEWAAVMQGSIWNTADVLAAIRSRVTKQPADYAPLSAWAALGTHQG